MFVPTISIINNALVAYENLHFMECKRRGKKGDVALKIDISKTHDTIDRGYLQEMLTKHGFHTNFVKWTILSVSGVNFYVNVNDEINDWAY